ncbi:MAG TPA: hypothetical protein DCS93_41465 [Microscillaceae bacterium]|nr:hypothetical protein [Microscillaceae bacterium]
MDNSTLNNSTREFVWKINKTPKMKANTPKKEESSVKTLVEKQFQTLSTILFDKIHLLENEIKTIKQQNTYLEQQLMQAPSQSQSEEFAYEPWYL